MRSYSFTVLTCLTLVASAELLGACSSPDAGGDDGPSQPGPTTGPGGGSPTGPGGGPPSATGGGGSGGGGETQAPDEFDGPDLCGNGLDDDENGVIDDGCVVPACTFGVKTLEFPTETFDNGLDAHVSFDATADVVLSTTGIDPGANGKARLFSLADGSLVQEVDLGPMGGGDLLRVKGGWLPRPWSVATHGVPLYMFDPNFSQVPLVGTGDGIPGNPRFYADGHVYTGWRSYGDLTRWLSYDTTIAATPIKTLETGIEPSSPRFAAAGGLPVLRMVGSSSFAYGFQNHALSPDAIRWTGEVRSGELGVYSLPHPSRLANELVTCVSGLVPNSGTPSKIRVQCHFENARTGATSRPRLTTDLAPESPPLGDGQRAYAHTVALGSAIGVVRSSYPNYGIQPYPTALTLDLLLPDGTYVTDVLDWSYFDGVKIFRAVELGNGRAALVMQGTRQEVGTRALIAVIGCQ